MLPSIIGGPGLLEFQSLAVQPPRGNSFLINSLVGASE
jgi:hypothetical protein